MSFPQRPVAPATATFLTRVERGGFGGCWSVVVRSGGVEKSVVVVVVDGIIVRGVERV